MKEEEKGTTEERWLDGITDLMDVSLSKAREMGRPGKPAVLPSMASQRARPSSN